jgi:tetratricopeptide (TPR) repeat protein
MRITFRSLVSAASLSWLLASGWVLSPAAQVTSSAGAQAPAASSAPSAGVRFDMTVRADFFAAFSGDMARFEKAMTLCEEVLKTDPDHAEALVWHGSGLLFRGGQAFQSGDNARGLDLYGRALGEMNRAVALAPDQIGVRIPRGASLFEATRFMPPAQAQQLLRLAISDYERALTLQEPRLAQLSNHARGELLFGLADGYARSGETEKARQFFSRVMKEAPASGRADYSRAWLDGKPPADVGRCTGCH